MKKHRIIRRLSNPDKSYLKKQLASKSSPLSRYLSQHPELKEEVTDAVNDVIVPIDQWIVTPPGYLKGCRRSDGLRHPVRRFSERTE